MHKGYIQTAAFLGALAVMLGAFAAHGLKQVFSVDNLQVFETAVRYQFYHVFALLAVGVLFKNFSGKLLRWAGYLFITGILLFCGSLYLLCYIKYKELGLEWIGAITPVGGAAFIAGWTLLGLGVRNGVRKI